ncbi:hypothetical protein P4C99_21495 [Pontiellaceae bacterium B1224]|nr:hypothetical protein [Pontiellaceae bacterium B1224]
MKLILPALLLVIVSLSTTGCSLFQTSKLGKTYAEQQAGYSYIPVEPTTVKINNKYPSKDGNSELISKVSILNALPDNSVRIATRQISGKADFGVPMYGADIGFEGNTYEVIIDFVNTQTINKQFMGKWYVNVHDRVKKLNRAYPFEQSVLEMPATDLYENWTLKAYLPTLSSEAERTSYLEEDKKRPEYKSIVLRTPDGKVDTIPYEEIQISYEPFNIPVYIGIGLRLKANVTVIKGEVNLSSLPALTAAVSAGSATGTMSVQTIGVSGRAARSNLLLLDKIDSTTIQNAVQVLSSIKASIESEETSVTPRIVGFHNTIGAGSQGVNLIHSLLAGDDNIELTLDPNSFATGSTSEKSETNGK